MTQRYRLFALAALALVAAPAGLLAAEWPGQPLRLVVTFPPGGSSDIAAHRSTTVPVASARSGTSSARAPMTPDLPAVVELGHPKLVAENFLGVSGPAGLPKPVVDKLHAALKEVAVRPEIVKRLDEFGVQSRPMSPAEFGSFVQKQVADWAGPVKASGARLN